MIQHDCCDKEIPSEVWPGNNVYAEVPKGSYYISIKRGKARMGLHICKDCMKKFNKTKFLEIK